MKKSKMEFADLHHHTEHSLLDAFGNVQTHVKRCVELGHSAVAMTEHGTLRGILALESACKKESIKPIFGCEFYVTKDHRAKGLTPEQSASVTAGLKGAEATNRKKVLAESLGINERRHLVLLAENEAGIQNLITLSNIANKKGFYHKPRIDLELLEKYSEGIIVNSGCIGSVISASALNGEMERAIDDMLWFKEVFGDRFSLEIQPHPLKEQRQWNKIAAKLSKAFDIPLIAANDSHYPAPDNWKVHDTLVAIGHSVRVDDCERMRYAVETFGLKGADSMLEAFDRVHPYLERKTIQDAIERAAQQAERCNAEVWKPKKVLLPMVSKKPNSVLKEIVLDGFLWRKIEQRSAKNGIPVSDYLDRIKHELGVIKGLKFSTYFLMVHDIIRFCREGGIGVGPGRGSSAGSLVCYLCGITAIDPMELGLLFERFLQPDRKDWPDIDMDFEVNRRQEVFEYLTKKYGEENVAQITTLTKLKGRSTLKDVARAHGVPLSIVEKITSSIVEEIARSDDGLSAIETAMESDPDMIEFARNYPLVVQQSIELEGTLRQVGVHPAGVVVSPIELDLFVPVERRLLKKQEIFVTAFDKDEIPELGLVKIDILGLKTLSVLTDAMKMVERRTGTFVDYEELDFDDQEVLDRFTAGDFLGVFQFDTATAAAACIDVVFDLFEDVIAINALNRPGPSTSGLADDWRERKKGKKGKKQNKIVAKICSDTLGVIVYQEHVIQILQKLAGYSSEEASRLRRAISKSKGAGYLEADRPVFVEGAVKVGGMGEEEADSLWTQIEKFGAYGFNKSHAAAYAAIAYWCQWMKVYHPVEFFCALMSHESDPAVASKIAREAERRGIRVKTPDVNFSGATWTVSPQGELLAGLGMIKGVGEKPSESIAKNAPYKSFSGFISKVNRRAVHKGVLVALAKSGALEGLVPNTKFFISEVEDLLKKVGKKGWVEELEARLEDSKSEDDYTDEDLRAESISVGISGTDPLRVLEGLRLYLRPKGDWTPIASAFNGCLISGVMVAKKVGTSGKRRWAAIEIEDSEGDKLRIRLDEHDFHNYRQILDSGIGAIIAARVILSKRSSAAKPAILIDMLELRKKWRETDPEDWSTEMSWQELSLFRAKENPAKAGGWNWWKGGTALVLSVKEVRDKNGRHMAFVSMDGGVGAVRSEEVVFFADLWEEVEDLVYPGQVLGVWGKKDKTSILIDEVKEVKK
jgi:DNA polymerase-3 subunit alpha